MEITAYKRGDNHMPMPRVHQANKELKCWKCVLKRVVCMFKPGVSKRIKELADFLHNVALALLDGVSRCDGETSSFFISLGPSTYIFFIPLYFLLPPEEYNFIKVDATVPTRNNSLAFNIVNYTSLLTVNTRMTSFRDCQHLRQNWGFLSLWCN